MLSEIYKVLKTDTEFLTTAFSQSQMDILEHRGDLASCIFDCEVQSRNGVRLVLRLLMLTT